MQSKYLNLLADVRRRRDAMYPTYQKSEELVRYSFNREYSDFSRTQEP